MTSPVPTPERTHRPPPVARPLNVGVWPWLDGGAIFLLVVYIAFVAYLQDALFAVSLAFPPVFLLVGSGAVLLEMAIVGLGIATILRARRMQRGVPGQVRITVMALGGIVHVAALLLLVPVLVGAFASMIIDPADLFLDVLDLGFWWKLAIGLLGGISAIGLLSGLGGLIACYWLISRKARTIVEAITDTILTIAFVVVTLLFPLKPAEGDPLQLQLAATRLVVTVLFALRVLARLLPPFLDLIELLGFHALVAARHLRARKSGFLTAIGILAILAVSVSSCALTTVLSVMGGFRTDLKRKILGNSAHVVVDREHGEFEGWGPVLTHAREVEGVVGVAPFVSGEVMVSSASNLSGAVLRGIDIHAIENVTELPRMMRHGRLEYLERPEELLNLPEEDLRGQLIPLETGSWRRRRQKRAEPPAPSDPDSFLRELDAELGPAPRNNAQKRPASDLDEFLRPTEGPRRDVLPGLVIGQELARTLRVYVGDEVNVVAPLGDLGPSGPMPKTRPFRVAGIFYSGMYEYDMKYCYVTLETAQRFLGVGDAISGIEGRVRDIESAPDIADRMKRAIGRRDLRVRDWQEMNAQLFGALELEKFVMSIFLGLAILVAGFCVFATLGLMVQEKSREVSILKAMGTADLSVIFVFLIEGILIGVFGAALGVGFGYVICFAAEHFGIKMNPEVYYIDKLPVEVDPSEFGMVAISAVLICLLATAYPAYSASRLHPAAELKDQ